MPVTNNCIFRGLSTYTVGMIAAGVRGSSTWVDNLNVELRAKPVPQATANMLIGLSMSSSRRMIYAGMDFTGDISLLRGKPSFVVGTFIPSGVSSTKITKDYAVESNISDISQFYCIRARITQDISNIVVRLYHGPGDPKLTVTYEKSKFPDGMVGIAAYNSNLCIDSFGITTGNNVCGNCE